MTQVHFCNPQVKGVGTALNILKLRSFSSITDTGGGTIAIGCKTDGEKALETLSSSNVKTGITGYLGSS